MTKLTSRQESILRIKHIRESIVSHGDYKDEMAELGSRLPERDDLPGIEFFEYAALSDGCSRPRYCEEVYHELLDEVEGIDDYGKSSLREAIIKTEALLASLKLMMESKDKVVDSLFTSGAYSKLEDAKIHFDWRESKGVEGGVDSRILDVELKLDIRQWES